MNQSDLIAKCAEKTGLTKTKIKEVLESLGETILEEVKKKETVTLPVIGRFTHKVSKDRSCRNPRTGELMKVPARAKMSFSPSSFVKETLSKK